ncbi:MAG: magnesium transporter MgtE N-terminal domain-containing protein, partial [Chthoniobacterales bacterium]
MDVAALIARCNALGPSDAAALLSSEPPAQASAALRELIPNTAQAILAQLPAPARQAILATTPHDVAREWNLELRYPDGSVGALMEPPAGVFGPDDTVGRTIEKLRDLTKEKFITYC